MGYKASRHKKNAYAGNNNEAYEIPDESSGTTFEFFYSNNEFLVCHLLIPNVCLTR